MRFMRAEDARKISENGSVEHILQEITDRIYISAIEGNNSLVVDRFGFGDNRFKSGEVTERQKKVLNSLGYLGYEIVFGEDLEGNYKNLYIYW